MQSASSYQICFDGNSSDELRELLDHAFREHKLVVLSLVRLSSLSGSLLGVVTSFQMKARIFGIRLIVQACETVFRSLLRMGWGADCLALSAAPRTRFRRPALQRTFL